MEMSETHIDDLPEALLWTIFQQIAAISSRNSLSLVCKRFYNIERFQRHSLKVGCGLHPVGPALSSLCRRFSQLLRLEIVYPRWTSKDGKQIDDQALNLLAKDCPSLKDLSLDFCSFITDTGLGNLSIYKDLEALRLNFTPGITGRGLLSVVTGCKNIRRLSLIRCLSVNDAEWLEFLGHYGKLESLAICNCRGIGEGDLVKLGAGWERMHDFLFEVDANHRYIKKLAHLSTQSSQLQNLRFQNLKVLNLTNCLTTPGRGLSFVLFNCKMLEELQLDMCVGLREDDMLGLLKNCSHLKSFSMRVPSDISPPRLSDTSLRAISIHCSKLQKISFSFADCEFPNFSAFTVAGLLALFEGCASLQVLVLDHAYFFNDKCMQALAISRSLKILELVQCHRVTDEGIRNLENSNIEELRLCRCMRITNWGFANFLSTQKFKILHVEDCPEISKKGIEGVAKQIFYTCDLSWAY